MKDYIFLFIVFSLFLNHKTNAQDIHFSQFELSPLSISPAMVGYLGDATDRVVLKYRNQWSSVLTDQSYETFLASYDGRFCRDGTENFWAFGISAMEDRAGKPTFQTNQYQGAVAYHMQLISGYFLSLGLQGGHLRYQIDPNNFNFDNEFDGGVSFLDGMGVEENLLSANASLWDVGGGLLFYNPSNSWNVGLGFQHITEGSYFAFTPSGFAEDNRVNTRWTTHIQIPVPFGKRDQHYFVGKIMALLQRPHWQFIAGGDFRLRLTKSMQQTFFKYLTVGLALRLSNRSENIMVADAGVLSLQTEISPNILMGASYDFNISPLQNANRSVGSFELSLIIQGNFWKREDCMNCFDFDTKKKGKRQKPRKM